MNSYPELLTRMMNAILAGETTDAPSLLREKQNFGTTDQLAVYTNGYRLRLQEAIASTYPALHYTLGEKTFETLAQGFIAAQPSRHFNLDRYTIAFGPYVAEHSRDAFAGDLARFESAIHEVYQAEETPAMNAQWMHAQGAQTLGAMLLVPRAASRLLTFEFPVEEYFTSFRALENPPRPETRQSWLIVLRDHHQVKRIMLEQAEFDLLSLLANGMTLGDALENEPMDMHTKSEDFAAHLTRWFARWAAANILRQPQ